MNERFSALIEELGSDNIDIEDQGFFPDYEVECYHDAFKWHPSGNYRTDDIIVEGSTLCPIPYLDENECVDEDKFFAAIRREIQKGIDNEDRTGPVYLVC